MIYKKVIVILDLPAGGEESPKRNCHSGGAQRRRISQEER